MPSNDFKSEPMPQIRFGIRSILVLATVVAVFMFGMNERQRYFREHVFVTVLEAATGTQVSEYRLRTWVITKDSGVAPEWSDWSKHNSTSSLPIKVPAHCRLVINVQAIGFPEGCHIEAGSMLVSPDLSHQYSVRITKSFRIEGSIVDATTGEPIAGVVVAPTSRLASQLLPDEAKTDSQGRFELYSDKPNDEIFAFHPRYQYRFMPSQSDEHYALYPGVSVRGRVIDKVSKDPIGNCIVNVMYRTGVPLTLAESPQGDLAIDDGTPAALRSKSPPRSTQTDSDGFFELYMESLALNTKLSFEKDGWHSSLQSANDPEIALVELTRGEYSLEGKVMDEYGSPVTAFTLSTSRLGGKGMMGMGETLTDHSIRNDDGYFQVFATKPYIGFSVHAEGYTTKRYGFKGEGFTRSLLESDFNESIRLSKGVRVSGEIKKTKSHSREVSAYLIDLESCNELNDLKLPLESHWYSDIGEIVFDYPKPWLQYKSRPESNGRYEFESIAAGRYALVVFYGDQTAAMRPIEIGDQHVKIPTIELPAFGRLQGILRERVGFTDTFPRTSETKINPFAIYYLHRDGHPFGIPFRTDHLGQFCMKQILVGKMTITSIGSRDLSNNREVAAFPISVRGGVTSMISDDSAPLCEILTEENDKAIDELDSGKVILHGVEESEGWMERNSELSPDGFRRYIVFGSIELPSGIYTVQINDGPFSESLDIDYRRNQPPTTKLLLHRRVSASVGRESSGSMGGAKATLIRNGHIESQFHIPFDSEYSDSCFVESSGPFDVLIDDYSNGYALLKNVSFSSESVELGEITWQRGAHLSVDVSLHGLDLFPEKVSIRHELTGVVYMEDHNWNYKTEFASLMPGKWTITVTGTDPLVGKKILFERNVELNSTENVQVDLRKDD